MKRLLAVVLGVGVVAGGAVAAFVLLSSEPNPVKEAAEITGHQRGADLLVSGEVTAGSDRRSCAATDISTCAATGPGSISERAHPVSRTSGARGPTRS